MGGHSTPQAAPSSPENQPTSVQEGSRRAIIDVGTNSVKLLVADLSPAAIEPVYECSEQTRLGSGFYESHCLQPHAIARTAEVVGYFTTQAKECGAGTVRVFATSAARDATNPERLIQAIRLETGIELEIIAGEREAEWAFCGASTNPDLAGRAFLLLDVGGGSTELIFGHGGHSHYSRSIRLGTVRLIESLPHSDPPTTGELQAYRGHATNYLRSEVKPELAAALLQKRRASASAASLPLVGTGGTASILAAMHAGLTRFDRQAIESTRLDRDILTGWVERLWRQPLADRRKLPGLPSSRADVILAGTVIFEAVMQEFELIDLRVSTRGIRFGGLLKG